MDTPSSSRVLTTGELTLESEHLTLIMSPERGGRIISLAHRLAAREALWRQSPRPDWPRYDAPASDADIQGWDECCPAIGPGSYPPGPWEGVRNPAQGEVYALPWRVLEADGRRAVLAVHGVRFPYELQRDVALVEPNMVRVRYRIANHSAVPFPFIWSAHPLLDASGGARIVLPDGVDEAIVDSTVHDRLGPVYGRIPWPRLHTVDGAEIDLSDIQPGTGWGDKLYVAQVPEGWCMLQRSDGLTVELHWDTATIPSLGIWIDTQGEGEARVALEPCLGYPDILSAAAEWGRHALLPPYGEQTWEMTLTVTYTPTAPVGLTLPARTSL